MIVILRAVPPRRSFAVLLFLGFVGSVGADVVPWPHELSDLAPNPAIVWGRLDNGFRYAIRANGEPKDGTSLRLLVLAGSLAEAAEQRGYAHFVEHMAFNGTRLFKRETLRGVLQRHGMAFGADVNATTMFDRTVYRLELPVSGPEQLQEGLTVMREFADGVSFEPTDVERERGVIFQENRMRDTASTRSGAAFNRFALPHSRLADRNPGGTEESIRDATAEGLREFYTTWYRADNLVLVAAGDFDPAVLARQIEETFKTMSTPATPRPRMELGRINALASPPVGMHHENGGGAPTCMLFAISPVPPVESRASRGEGLLRTLAFAAFNLRLGEVARRHEKRFFSVQAECPTTLSLMRQPTLIVAARAGEWRPAIATGEQELRRAREHGFTAAEIAEARKGFLADIATYERDAALRPSRAWAGLLTDALAENRVPTAPRDFSALSHEIANGATPESCLRAFRDAWGATPPRLFVHGHIAGRRPVESFTAAYAASARKAVAAPSAGAKAGAATDEFAYTEFGPPGIIVKRDYDEARELHRVEFANGVRLNLKATSVQPNLVLYQARFGYGGASEPRDQPGLRYTADAFVTLGLERHDIREIRRLMTGEDVTLGLEVLEDAFRFAGNSDSAGGERLFQLLTAYFLHPGWRKDAWRGVVDAVLAGYAERDNTPGALLELDRIAFLASQDSRYRRPPQKAVRARSVNQLRAWLGPQLKSAPLEVGVVGDFEVEEMIALAGRTIGCLPPRQPWPKPPAVNFVARVDPPRPVEVSPASRHGAVQVTWAAPAEHDLFTACTLELLAEVLRDRLFARIREEMGATYSLGCWVARSDFQPEAGHMTAALTCGPTDAKRVGELVRQIADELAGEGVTVDELERARQPKLQAVPTLLGNNAGWIGPVSVAQSQPDALEGMFQRADNLARITTADVNALAAKILLSARASVFTTIPKTEARPTEAKTSR